MNILIVIVMLVLMFQVIILIGIVYLYLLLRKIDDYQDVIFNASVNCEELLAGIVVNSTDSTWYSEN